MFEFALLNLQLMENLEKTIPYILSKTLNDFNNLLAPLKKKVFMEAVPLNTATQKQINISYRFKNTNFFFRINYVLVSDFISWQYYPFSRTSTKTTSMAQISSNDTSIYNSLSNSLISWKKICEDLKQIENPIKFFQIDDCIQFYANEIFEEIPENEADKKFPLSSLKQAGALKLLNLQNQFLEIEIEKIENRESEEYCDLVFAKELLNRIIEELPRTTASEVKKNWIISLACVRKWCAEKFIAFLSADKNTNYDLSRTLGSLIGGIFNIPKLEP